MKMKEKQLLKLVILMVMFIVSCYQTALAQDSSFFHVEGMEFVAIDGKPFTIRSVSLMMDEKLVLTDVYSNISKLGFNTVNLHINYALLEKDNKPFVYLKSGWKLLNAHIAAAKNANIRIILNMDSAQGSNQSDDFDSALWNDQINQDRLTALWGAIADYYKNEPMIVGYSLLNEPKPLAETTMEGFAQWKELSNRLYASIREYDVNHIIFIQNITEIIQPNGTVVALGNSLENNFNFPIIDDVNIAYEFHMYETHSFTHQADDKSDNTILPSVYYPNETLVKYDYSKWLYESSGNDQLDINNSESQYLGSGYVGSYKDINQFMNVGLSIFKTSSGGEIWIDSMWLEEYDAEWNYLGNIIQLSGNNPARFKIWNKFGSIFEDFQSGGGSVQITDLSNYTVSILNHEDIYIKPEHNYRLCMYVRNSGFSEYCTIEPWIGVYECGDYYTFDKEYLTSLLDAIVTLRNFKGKIPFIVEFGTSNASFEKNHGGEVWVGDMMNLLEERDLSFNYFAYNDDKFGIVGKDSGYTNDALSQVLAETLQSRGD